MTALTKAGLFILFFALVVILIALLPDTTQYPLPPQFTASVTVVLAYVFTWATFFWFISVWFQIMLLTMGLEITIWIAKKIIWIIGFAARMT